MPRYVVQRTFPDGLQILAGNGGSELCQTVVERNARKASRGCTRTRATTRARHSASTTGQLRRRFAGPPLATGCRSTRSPTWGCSTSTSTCEPSGQTRDDRQGANLRSIRIALITIAIATAVSLSRHLMSGADGGDGDSAAAPDRLRTHCISDWWFPEASIGALHPAIGATFESRRYSATGLVPGWQRDRWRRGCCFGACNVRAPRSHRARRVGCGALEGRWRASRARRVCCRDGGGCRPRAKQVSHFASRRRDLRRVGLWIARGSRGEDVARVSRGHGARSHVIATRCRSVQEIAGAGAGVRRVRRRVGAAVSATGEPRLRCGRRSECRPSHGLGR